jgi:hypothetical protein
VHPNHPEPKFIVTVKDVREVSLVAAADISFWREKVEPAGLFPFSLNGKAELTFSATDIRFLGKQTYEFTIGLAVSRQPDGSSLDGRFLVRAFNSSSLFAWIERTLFKTPYYPGFIRLEDQIPAWMTLSDARGPIIQAQMSTPVAPTHSQDQLWQGPIYLPAIHEKPARSGRLFYASLGGFTVVYPYSTHDCSFVISHSAEYPFVQWLLDSQLTPIEWRIRSQAVHARSKTYLWRDDIVR